MVRTERGAHVTWCLEVPVAKHHAARQGPETYLARVAEYFHHALGADPAFSGLGRNPVHPVANTIWGREAPYSLDDLANVIPFGWKRPRVALTGLGRNVDAFRAGMKWAGEDRNRGLPVLPALHSINAEVSRGHPDGLLSDNELADIARSIERYRAAWERGGWHKPAWVARQAARGRMGKGVPRKASLFDDMTNEDARPWDDEGIHRSTWYRRKAMPTENQTAYIEALASQAGLSADEALAQCAAAGRDMHHATNAAFLTRAWDAGRVRVDSLTVREASKLITSLNGALNYGNPDLGVRLALPCD